MIRRRFLKTAVPQEEHSAICQRADAEGMTLAGYVRVALARDVERQNLAQTLAAVRAALPNGGGATLPASFGADLQELLQLVRLLANQANPQGAARITAAINHQYPERKTK